jgi:4,5-dihydroxyphthalate decarboxylase
MSKVRINLACWDYDRMQPLIDGRVKPEGIDLNFLPVWIEESVSRMLKHKEFEAAEMSLSAYSTFFSPDDPELIAIPIFPSRTFRHRSIYINTHSGISKPTDIVGKRVGLPRFTQTACVWMRGMMAEHYGVPLNSVTYYVGGLELPELESEYLGENFSSAKSDIKVKAIGKEKVLSKMLDDGEIDVLYSARAPSSFKAGSKNVGRLFSDYPAAEKEYYQRTKIFPIMHTIVLRRDVYKENPWVCVSLLKAATEAKRLAYNALFEVGVLRYMLPWMNYEAEEVRKLMGKDYWPYGVAPNYKVIDTFLKYVYEQGQSKTRLTPEQVFAKETLGAYVNDDFAPPMAR